MNAAEKIEEADAFQNLAHPFACMDNPQGAVDRNRHVVRPDEFADAGGINSGDSAQVQQNRSVATPQQCPDLCPQVVTHRHTKRPFNVKRHRNDRNMAPAKRSLSFLID